jgi:hypothetical protein
MEWALPANQAKRWRHTGSDSRIQILGKFEEIFERMIHDENTELKISFE